jgi:hypothetical protein
VEEDYSSRNEIPQAHCGYLKKRQFFTGVCLIREELGETQYGKYVEKYRLQLEITWN